MPKKEKKNVLNNVFFNRYEGYEKEIVIDEQGNKNYTKKYSGLFYKRNIDDKRNIINNAIYWGMFFISILAFFFASSREIGANYMRIAKTFEVLTIFGYIWLVTALFNYSTVPEEMTIGEYKLSSKNLINCSFFLSMLMIINIIVVIGYLFIDHSQLVDHIMYSLLYLLGAVTLFIVFRNEKKLPYITLE